MNKELLEIKNNTDIDFIIKTGAHFTDFKSLSGKDLEYINFTISSITSNGLLVTLFDRAFEQIMQNYAKSIEKYHKTDPKFAQKQKLETAFLNSNKNLVKFLSALAREKDVVISQMLEIGVAQKLLKNTNLFINDKLNNLLLDDFIDVFSHSGKSDKTSFLINYVKSKELIPSVITDFMQNIQTAKYRNNFDFPTSFSAQMLENLARLQFNEGWEFNEESFEEALILIKSMGLNAQEQIPKYLDYRLPNFLDNNENQSGMIFLNSLDIIDDEHYLQNFDLVIENMKASIAIAQSVLDRAEKLNIKLNQNIKNRLYNIAVNDIDGMHCLISESFCSSYFDEESFKIKKLAQCFDKLKGALVLLEKIKDKESTTILSAALNPVFNGSIDYKEIVRIIFIELRQELSQLDGEGQEIQDLICQIDILEQKILLEQILDINEPKTSKVSKAKTSIKAKQKI